jgi:hypothetical protein
VPAFFHAATGPAPLRLQARRVSRNKTSDACLKAASNAVCARDPPNN